jgi:hypothetical protein
MRYDRTVIGYHGCDATLADDILAGREKFKPSVNDYDWLGPGVYFWEFGADRARRWADDQVAAGKCASSTGAVVGAIIQLGECFDLLDTRFTKDLGESFTFFRDGLTEQGRDLPSNKGKPPELKLRYLDCAMITWYLNLAEGLPGAQRKRYDTVRGGFVEGPPAFDGSGIQAETHIQIAVRRPECIIGVFRPLA